VRDTTGRPQVYVYYAMFPLLCECINWRSVNSQRTRDSIAAMFLTLAALLSMYGTIQKWTILSIPLQQIIFRTPSTSNNGGLIISVTMFQLTPSSHTMKSYESYPRFGCGQRRLQGPFCELNGHDAPSFCGRSRCIPGRRREYGPARIPIL
jgi:hypothetical protein